MQEADERGSLSGTGSARREGADAGRLGQDMPSRGPARTDRLETAIPGARKAIIDNCGHMPQLERAVKERSNADAQWVMTQTATFTPSA